MLGGSRANSHLISMHRIGRVKKDGGHHRSPQVWTLWKALPLKSVRSFLCFLEQLVEERWSQNARKNNVVSHR